LTIIIHLTIIKRTQTLTDSEMEEEAGLKEVKNGHEEKIVKEEIFTRVVRAGKRTYFFDVKATRNEDYYLTITESKKRLGKEGKVFYEKHKLFLYKEDFDKFTEGLKESVTYIVNNQDEVKVPEPSSDIGTGDQKSILATEEFTNVEFEDLGKK